MLRIWDEQELFCDIFRGVLEGNLAQGGKNFQGLAYARIAEIFSSLERFAVATQA